MTGRVMKEAMLEGIFDVEAAPSHGISILYGIIQYKELSAYSVTDGLCHYSACHSPDFIMPKKKYEHQLQKFKMKNYNV
jgi:hypothetical protein